MKEKSRQSGFSLIELMIALVILAVGILGIAQLQVAAIRSLTLSRHTTMATQLAMRESEWLRGLPIPLNPTDPPMTTAGTPIFDGDGVSVLLDVNGLTTMSPTHWHFIKQNEALNEHGTPAGPGQMKFYMRWSVERCCALGADGAYDGATRVLQVPGNGQIAIQIQVFWWESNKRKPASIDYKTIDEAVLKATNGHLVELRTVRTADL